MLQDEWRPRTGGGPVHVRELSKVLAREFCCEVDIFTRCLTRDGEADTETTELAGGDVTVYRRGPCVGYWNPVGRCSSVVSPIPTVVANEYDIVHGHTFLPAIPTRVSSALGSAASVFTVHGTALTTGVGRDTTVLSKFKRIVERILVLEFDYDHVISVNGEHLSLLKRYHRAVSCIPNGVDPERFDIDEPRVDGRILFLGRLAPKKRVSDLIRAFDRITTGYPDAELVIVGEGPRKECLEALVADRGITGRVTFTGRVDTADVPRYYRSAELFVLPSVWEGHPLTVLEAWAAGCPVIASNVEGIAEFVDHGETGYLVAKRNPSELAEALRYALDNPQEAADWGEAGRQKVEVNFTWKKVGSRTREVYDRVTG